MQKQLRLTRRQDFSKIYRSGKSFANRQFVLYSLFNSSTEQFRLGVSVSKKLGNAVVRNRMRRLMKEIVRLHASQITVHFDYVLIARLPAVSLEYKELEKSILHVFRKSVSLHKK